MTFYLMFVAGAVSGGFINGLGGFGTAMFALSWWLQIMPPLQAIAVVLVISLSSGIQGVIFVRKSIDARRLAYFLVPALFGIPFGLQILRHIDVDLLKTALGGLLLAFGGFFSVRRNLPKISRPTPVVHMVLGFVGGILGATAGLSGALPTMWLSLKDWPKEMIRGVLQPFNFIVLAISAVLLAIDGAYNETVFWLLAVAIPTSFASARVGIWAFKRLSDTAYRRLLIALMFIFGAIMLFRQLATA